MAKTIKFNLICDGKSVRTIEDLQNNFSIEDILAYYRNGLLTRWLKVRGYTEELEKVNAISKTDSLGIIKALIQIFNMSADSNKIEQEVYILEYLEESRELLNYYREENFKKESIIDDYATGYRQLVDGILQNPDDVALIKANIREIVNNYAWVLELNHRELFNTLKENGGELAIMCLLMNDTCRKYYLPIEETQENGSIILDVESKADKRAMYNEICKMVAPTKISALKNLLNKEGRPELLKSFSQNTQQYPVFVEPADKKCMIVYMDSGDRIAPFGSIDFIESAKTSKKFPIYDGIQYMSNCETHTMYYMEV